MPILPPRLGFKMMSNAPTFFRDFATNKTLDHGFGPNITFTRTGTATYFDSNGTLITATANTPRFDHDPVTLASRGLLIEEGRTNSIANSQGTGAVAGTAGTAPTGWSISGNANGLTRTIATGSINGFSYIDVTTSGTTTSSNIGIVFDPQSSTAGYTASTGQTWAGSVYLALVNGSFPGYRAIRVSERNSSNTLIANTDVQLTGITSSLQRFTATRTLNNADTAKVTFDIRVENIPISTAVNFTLRIAAPQLEQGAFATSYIPTTSAAVTRGADSAVVTPISSFYNASEGTLFFENVYTTAVYNSASNYWGNPMRFYRNDPPNNRPYIEFYTQIRSTGATLGQSIKLVSSDNTIQAEVGFASAITAASTNKYAAGYATNDVATFRNGTAGNVDTGVNLTGFEAINSLSIGIGTGGNYINGHIRKVGYWPRRLSNANLQAMTA